MSAITTHVLDTSRGRPAQNVAVELHRVADESSQVIGRSATDADGRVRDLLPAGHPLETGVYRLDFDTGAYFAASGIEAFYPSVSIVFQVRAADEHHHVPLLLNPFGYSTYRGS